MNRAMKLADRNPLRYGDSVLLEIESHIPHQHQHHHHQQRTQHHQQHENLTEHPQCEQSQSNPFFLSACDPFSLDFSSRLQKSKIFISNECKGPNLYLNSIFQIKSAGFNALDPVSSSNEPVSFADTFYLFLKSSGFYLRTSSSKNVVSFGVDLKEGLSKGAFRFKLKHDLRSESDNVFYNDIFYIQEAEGRTLSYIEQSNQLIMGTNPQFFCSFRLTPLIKYADVGNGITAGDIVTLKYINFSAYLSSLSNSNSNDHTQDAAAHNEVSTIPSFTSSEKEEDVLKDGDASSMWIIETVFPVTESRFDAPEGILYDSRTNVRFRNLMSNFYLQASIADSTITQVRNPNDSCIFTVNIIEKNTVSEEEDMNKEGEVILSSSLVTISPLQNAQMNIELFGASSKCFGLSGVSNNHQATAFRIQKVANNLTNELLQAKKICESLQHSFNSILKNENEIAHGKSDNLFHKMFLIETSISTFNFIFDLKQHKRPAEYVLEKHFNENYLDKNSYNPDSSDRDKLSQLNYRQNALAGFDIIIIMLNYLDFALSQSQYSGGGNYCQKAGENLLNVIYIAFEYLFIDNSKLAKLFVDLDGINIIIRHMTIIRTKFMQKTLLQVLVSLNTDDDPDDNAEEMNSDNRVNIISDQSIEALFDMIADCRRLKDTSSNLEGNNNNNNNKNNNNHENSFDSNFVFDMLIQLCNYLPSLEMMQIKICIQMLGSRYSLNPNKNIYLFGTVGKYEGSLVVVTSNIGLQRPSQKHDYDSGGMSSNNIEGDAVYLPADLESRLDKADIPKFTRLTFEALGHLSKSQMDAWISIDETFESVSAAPGNENLRSAFSALVTDDVHFKKIENLNANELKYFCASINLLAALCKNRNMYCQSIVRRYISIDHILIGLHTKLNVDLDLERNIGLLRSKSALMNLLLNCYVDSATLPELPKSKFEISDIFKSSNSKLRKTWEAVYIDECNKKVFSISSQMDEISLPLFGEEVNDNLIISSIRDIQKFMDEFGNEDFTPLPREIKYVLTSDISSLNNASDRKMAEMYIEKSRKERMNHYMKLNKYSYVQRRVLNDFIFASIDFHNFNDDLYAHLGGLDDKGILHSEYKENLLYLMTYSESLLRLMKSLLCRRAFDDEYNVEPYYWVDISESTSYGFYSNELIKSNDSDYRFTQPTGKSNRVSSTSSADGNYESDGGGGGGELTAFFKLTEFLTSFIEHRPLQVLRSEIRSEAPQEKNMADIKSLDNIIAKTFDSTSIHINLFTSCLQQCCDTLKVILYLIQLETVEQYWVILNNYESLISSSAFSIQSFMSKFNSIDTFDTMHKFIVASMISQKKVSKYNFPLVWDIDSLFSSKHEKHVFDLLCFKNNLLNKSVLQLLKLKNNLLVDFKEFLTRELQKILDYTDSTALYLERNKYSVVTLSAKISNYFKIIMESKERNFDEMVVETSNFLVRDIQLLVMCFDRVDDNNMGLIQFCYGQSISATSGDGSSSNNSGNAKNISNKSISMLQSFLSSSPAGSLQKSKLFDLSGVKEDRQNMLLKAGIVDDLINLLSSLRSFVLDNAIVDCVQTKSSGGGVALASLNKSSSLKSLSKSLSSINLKHLEAESSNKRIIMIRKNLIDSTLRLLRTLAKDNKGVAAVLSAPSTCELIMSFKAVSSYALLCIIELLKTNKSVRNFFKLDTYTLLFSGLDDILNSKKREQRSIMNLSMNLDKEFVVDYTEYIHAFDILLIGASGKNAGDAENVIAHINSLAPSGGLLSRLTAWGVQDSSSSINDEDNRIDVHKSEGTSGVNGVAKLAPLQSDGNISDPSFLKNSLCSLYFESTGRVAYLRSPESILEDSVRDQAYVNHFLSVVDDLKPLSNTSFLSLHLKCVETMSHFDLRGIIGSFKDKLSCTRVLEILMIDKLEIKRSYLKYLDAKLFIADISTSTSTSASATNVEGGGGRDLSNFKDVYASTRLIGEIFSDSNKKYVFALFKSIQQDICLLNIIYQPQNLLLSSSKSRNRNDNIELLRDYVESAVFPFIFHFTSSNALELIELLGVSLHFDFPMGGSTGKSISIKTVIEDIIKLLRELCSKHDFKSLEEISKKLEAFLKSKEISLLENSSKSGKSSVNHNQAPVRKLASSKVKLHRNTCISYVVDKVKPKHDLDVCSILTGFIYNVTSYLHFQSIDPDYSEVSAKVLHSNIKELPSSQSTNIDLNLSGDAFNGNNAKKSKSVEREFILEYIAKLFDKYFADLKSLGLYHVTKHIYGVLKQYGKEFLNLIWDDGKFEQGHFLKMKNEFPSNMNSIIISHLGEKSISSTGIINDEDEDINITGNRKNRNLRGESKIHPSKFSSSEQTKSESAINPIKFLQQNYLETWTMKGGKTLIWMLKHLETNCTDDKAEDDNTYSYWIDAFVNILNTFVVDDNDDNDDNEVTGQLLENVQFVLYKLGVVTVVIRIISHINFFLRKNKLISEEHRAAMKLGVAMLHGGNPIIQNALIDKVEEEISFDDITSAKYFMPSFRTMITHYIEVFTIGVVNKTDLVYSVDVQLMMKLISLLCEGHNQRVQLFMLQQNCYGSVNIVSFVAQFAKAISEEMLGFLKTLLYKEIEVPSVVFPKILGRKRGIINWSLVSSSTISALIQYSKIMTAILDCLTELTQGPCYENQLAIDQVGISAHFSGLFEFFGALQVVRNMSNDLFKEMDAKDLMEVLKKDAKDYIFHNNKLVEIITQKELIWSGSDPYLINFFIGNVADKNFSATLLEKSRNSTADVKKSLLNLLCYRSNEEGRQKTYEQTPPSTPLTKSRSMKGGRLDDIKDEDQEVFNLEICSPSGKSAATDGSKQNQYFTDYNSFRSDRTAFVESLKSENARGSSKSSTLESKYVSITAFTKEFMNLECSCLKSIRACIEGTKIESSEEVSKKIFESIGTDNFVCNMENYWSRFGRLRGMNKNQKSLFESSIIKEDICELDEAKLAFEYYYTVMSFYEQPHEFLDSFRKEIDEWKMDDRNVDKHIARVELLSEDRDSIIVTYFPVPAVVRNYWKRAEISQLRDKIIRPLDTGGRDSVDEKIASFIQEGNNLIDLLNHFQYLNQLSKVNIFLAIIIYFSTNLWLWSNLYFVMSIVINVMMISQTTGGLDVEAFQNHDLGDYQDLSPHDGLFTTRLKFLGAFQCAISFASISAYTFMYGILHVQKGLKENPDDEFEITGPIGRFVVGTLCGKIIKKFIAMDVIEGISITLHLPKFVAMVYYYLIQKNLLYYVFLSWISIMGTFQNPLWFSLSLVELLRIFKAMLYVSMAFTTNINQVVATLVLTAVIIYIFVVFSVTSPELLNQYNINSHVGCNSLNSCLRMHIDYGVTTPLDWDGVYIHSALGAVYNFLYVFIVQIVIPGIISGIIIDTFAAQREANDSMNEDVQNTCFICNIPREDFEAANESFEDHIKNDHNCWKYIWYIIYILGLRTTEFNGVEQFCYQQYTQNMNKWLPVKVAKVLSSRKSDKSDLYTINAKITTIKSNVDRVWHVLDSINSTQDKLDKRLQSIASQLSNSK